MRILFNSFSTGKQDRLLGSILVPQYICSYAKRAWLQFFMFWIAAKNHTAIGYIVSRQALDKENPSS